MTEQVDSLIVNLSGNASEPPQTDYLGYEHLDEATRKLLDSVHITRSYSPLDFTTCDSCSNFSRVYSYQVRNHERDGSTWYLADHYKFCHTCILAKIHKRLLNYAREYNISSAVEDLAGFYIRNMEDLFPIKNLPQAEESEPATCVCDRYIAQGNEAYAHNNEGKLVAVHRGCFWRCGTCEENFISWGNSAVRYRLFFGRNTCPMCAEQIETEHADNDWELMRCYGCESMWSEDDMHYSDNRDSYFCTTCYNYPIECDECGHPYREGNDHTCYLNEGSHIFNYSYKPRARFFGDDTYYFGFELEVENTYEDEQACNDTAGLVSGLLRDRVYCKEDGSLDTGFEIVTHPHSLTEYHTNFNWSFLDILKRNDFESWNNTHCGFHVHVSKTAFNSRKGYNAEIGHKARFTKFIYDNQYQVERIAGRKANDYAKFGDTGNVFQKVKHDNQREGRYEVVNVYNEHTYEIRIFRGSLRKERLLSNIEFVHAVVEFTRNMKVVPKDKPFAWSRFVAFVSNNDTQYPNLITILNEAFASERIKAEI